MLNEGTASESTRFVNQMAILLQHVEKLHKAVRVAAIDLPAAVKLSKTNLNEAELT